MPVNNRIDATLTDITSLNYDAIVNAANNSLLGGGGVDGAIHKAAGPALLRACKKLGGCETGAAKITLGYKLRAKYVIHTVGPVWRDGGAGEAKLLAQCYTGAFALAHENQVRTIAFPAISCGVYGFPVEPAARIAITETVAYLENYPQLDHVLFACFNDEILHAYTNEISKLNKFNPDPSRP